VRGVTRLRLRAVLPSRRTQRLPGTGLGLSIVKRVAQASGGDLSFEPRLGLGSTFVVHLPLAERPRSCEPR
jgi:signal transduction histidine kinase